MKLAIAALALAGVAFSGFSLAEGASGAQPASGAAHSSTHKSSKHHKSTTVPATSKMTASEPQDTKPEQQK